MGWALFAAVLFFIYFLFQKQKRVKGQAHNSSLFLKQLWAQCPQSHFSFCDLVEVFMFTIAEKYFFAPPGRVKTTEFKIMLDDMAYEYLPECGDRLLLLKSSISDDGFFDSGYKLTISDAKAQDIINTIDAMDYPHP